MLQSTYTLCQMDTRAIVAALLLLLIVPHESVNGQANGCPEEYNDHARTWVMSLLESSQDMLQRDGIDASPGELRLMTNDQDPDACADLVHPYLSMEEGEDSYRYQDFFYTTGEYYFMVKVVRPLEERPGDSPWEPESGNIMVFDAEYNLLAIYA